MSKFGHRRALAAWSGTAPGNNESAGTRRRAGALKGNLHLKTAFETARRRPPAHRGTYLAEKYRPHQARSGPGRAAGHRRA